MGRGSYALALLEKAMNKKILREAALGVAAICLLGAGITLRARAQAAPLAAEGSGSQGAMRWRMIGPSRGGRVLAVEGIAGNPAVYYFAANGGGVWKTTDGGTVWKPIFDAEPVQSIGALAVAKSNPEIVYVGTGEDSLHSQVSYGDGVYRSDDGGKHWRHLGLAGTRHIGKIIVDPRNPEIVLVAAIGHVYAPNPERGVFRSADGGKTWNKVLYKDDSTGAVDLSFDPDNPKTVYATLWHGVRTPWQHGANSGPGSGIYKSTDEGLSWKPISGHGLPEGNWGRVGVAVGPGTKGKRVYAIVEAKKDNGLYRSDDAGGSWKRATMDSRIRGTWFFGQIFVDPRNADVIYVPETTLFRSSDGGKTFTALKGAPGGDDYHVVWVDPQNSQRIILGCDQGASVSLDGGATWSSWYNQPTAQMYHVATDHRFPYYVYGAQQDSGTIGIASRGDYGQITEREWFQVGPGESGYTLPDPAEPNIVYNAGPGGDVVRFFRKTGQVQDISPQPPGASGDLRLNWTIPLAFSPQDPHVLYLGAQYLLKTTNAGTNWTSASPDLTEDPRDTSKGKGKGTIYTIAPSPVEEGEIWVGTNNGLVQLTRDGGKSWKNVTPPGVTPWSEISLIEASHFDSGAAYAAVNRRSLDDQKPHIYRTHDFGATWEETVKGIKSNDFIRVVREDPVRKGLLFAGAETGVYVSLDDGENWESLTLNLPAVSVRDLAIQQGDLVAATHGRSFWILDDITPFRQMNAENLASAGYLFAPRTAIRIRRDENQNTPLPPEIPAGQNPPDGATIYYRLKDAPAGEVTLEIHDARGALVRRYSSSDPLMKPKEEPYVAAYWLAQPVALSKAAGMHRFVWDLRYTSPAAIHEQSPYNYPISAIVGATPAEPQGPLVVPGKYEARLSAGGQTYSQWFDVKMDPRVKYRRNELESQRDLELKMSAALEVNHAAYEQVKDLRSRLADVEKGAGDEAVKKAAAELDAKATGLEGGAPSDFTEARKGVSFKAINEALTAQLGLADLADFGPTAQMESAYEAVCGQLGTALKQWKAMQASELAGLNSQLASHSMPGLPAPPALPAGAEACALK